MALFHLCLALVLVWIFSAAVASQDSFDVNNHELVKRILPENENCDPQARTCRKGDWVSESIADCEKDQVFTCNAKENSIISWIVDVPTSSRGCRPVMNKRLVCGAEGTNTRCVCSSYKAKANTCKCQYWLDENPGMLAPGFCTGYYVAGTSTVHHYACCNNCNDASNTCDGVTWQGGSSIDYCLSCGTRSTSTGREKYFFNCGGCDQQRNCESLCNNKFLGFGALPGLCWKWLDCFRGCCLASAQQPIHKRQTADLAFCGDTVCSGAETPSNCPTDCCYKVNPACSKENHVCHQTCCGDATCCIDQNGGAITIISSYSIVVLLIISLVSQFQ